MAVRQIRNCMSSTLMKLKIYVDNFVDCLLLLDGRLDCLSTLIIKVSQIFEPAVDIGGRVSIISIIMLQKKNSILHK
jgi:hypothetical protein